MNRSNLDQFAYVSADYLSSSPVRAVFVTFPGLGSTEMRSALDPADVKLAREGALFVYPFVNPWNWMNARTVKFVDEVLAQVYRRHRLNKKCPLIARGGSMGGYSALTYAMFARRKPDAVIANCPVTDLHFHLTERPDLPRTIHDAMGSYENLTQILKERSPNHRPEKLPAARYLIVHGGRDKSVNKAAHSDKLVKQMRRRGLDVTYVEDERMGHCNPMQYETVMALEAFTASCVRPD